METDQRLAYLENRVRLLGAITSLLLFALLIFALLGAAPNVTPKTIDASALRVLDDEGRPRITLEVQDEQPTIRFLSEEGKTFITLRTREGRGGFYYIDKNGTPRVELALTKNGPVLHFIGENSALRASLTGTREQSKLELFDSRGLRITP